VTLTSEEHRFETVDDALEYAYEAGWTDGLPVVPPTIDKVQTMLAAAGVDPDVELGGVPTRNVTVTAEKAAINAVMAGCRPDYFPVVLAAVRAFLQPEANAHSTTATLAGAADEIGIESGQACFGPGFRANATIGRALRLVIRNACRAVPGVLDRASFSWPLRYSFCFGEHEEASDWTPLHVQLGFERTQSVVTIQSILHFFPVTEFEPEPTEILDAIVSMARYRGMMRDEWAGDGRSIVLVVGEEHQRRLVDGGWTKESMQEYLWSPMVADDTAKTDKKLNLAAPDNILIVAAGGPGLAQSWLFQPHLACPTSAVV
jgi:hypothetical protein